MSKAAVTDLLVYDEALTCGELLTLAAPVMISDSFDAAPLLASSAEAIWAENGAICHTQADAAITLTQGAGYSLKTVN